MGRMDKSRFSVHDRERLFSSQPEKFDRDSGTTLGDYRSVKIARDCLRQKGQSFGIENQALEQTSVLNELRCILVILYTTRAVDLRLDFVLSTIVANSLYVIDFCRTEIRNSKVIVPDNRSDREGIKIVNLLLRLVFRSYKRDFHMFFVLSSASREPVIYWGSRGNNDQDLFGTRNIPHPNEYSN